MNICTEKNNNRRKNIKRKTFLCGIHQKKIKIKKKRTVMLVEKNKRSNLVNCNFFLVCKWISEIFKE